MHPFLRPHIKARARFVPIHEGGLRTRLTSPADMLLYYVKDAPRGVVKVKDAPKHAVRICFDRPHVRSEDIVDIKLYLSSPTEHLGRARVDAACGLYADDRVIAYTIFTDVVHLDEEYGLDVYDPAGVKHLARLEWRNGAPAILHADASIYRTLKHVLEVGTCEFTPPSGQSGVVRVSKGYTPPSSPTFLTRLSEWLRGKGFYTVGYYDKP